MPIEMLARLSTESVKKRTGKDWDQWITLLNKAGGKNRDFQDLVTLLKKKHKVTPWWAQGIAIGYETHIGRRIDGANKKGLYAVTVTKSIHTSAAKLWKYLASPEGIAVWLTPLSDFKLKPKQSFEREGDVFGEVRTMKAGERARLTWQESDWPKKTVVQLMVVKRPGEKSILAFMHEQIPNPRLREQLRAHWRDVVDRVHKILKT